ncbi:Glutathione-binding protein GsiB [archaeon HR06]|nr:Glutathione-binding protein GsiB [archaeon HR06]
MVKDIKKIDRRKFIYAGLGAVAVAAIGVAAYFATRPPERVVETVVQTQTVEKPVEKVVTQTVEKPVTMVTTVAGTPTTIVQTTKETVVTTQTIKETVEKPVEITVEAVPVYGGVFKVATYASPSNFDPHVAPAHPDLMVAETGYEYLFRYDENFNLVPWLAEKYEVSPDNLEYTFYLRKGIMWQIIDRELTAEDVAYSLNRTQEFGLSKSFFPIWGEAKAVDKYVVKVRFPEPFAPFLFVLANPGARGNMIVPKLSEAELSKIGLTAEEFKQRGFATKIVGTGPFMLKEFKRGEFERFAKNDKYWAKDSKGRKLPYLDGLEFIPQGDASIRATYLRAGTVDMALGVDAKDLPLLQTTKGLKIIGQIGTWFGHIGMNWRDSPFSDKRVRQAVAYAINKEEILKLALNGGGEVAWSPLPNWNKDYKAFKSYEYNPDKAKELMKEAGVTEITGTLYGYPISPAPETMQVVQRQLAAVNINLEIKLVDIGTYVAELRNRDIRKHTITMHIWVDKVEPWTSLGQRLYPPGGTAFAEGLNPDLEKTGLKSIRDGLARELNPEKRRKMVEDLQRIWIEEVVSVPLWFKANYWGINEKVKNLKVEPQTINYNWESIWKEK